MSYEDLPCRDFVELATEYLEGALTPAQRLVVERHLAFCHPCVDYLEQMRAVIRATGTLREQDVPEPVMESLLAAFKTLSSEPD
ncbi:MAG TPA: zf-HC2 domain-containing protein [Solirubrobacteraceae bacterium]|jgi:anti-sigma factor RsiW